MISGSKHVLTDVNGTVGVAKKPKKTKSITKKELNEKLKFASTPHREWRIHSIAAALSWRILRHRFTGLSIPFPER